jgi:hypothetical protein
MNIFYIFETYMQDGSGEIEKDEMIEIFQKLCM